MYAPVIRILSGFQRKCTKNKVLILRKCTKELAGKVISADVIAEQQHRCKQQAQECRDGHAARHALLKAFAADDRLLWDRLKSWHETAKLPADVSILRVFDVVAWMEQRDIDRREETTGPFSRIPL